MGPGCAAGETGGDKRHLQAPHDDRCQRDHSFRTDPRGGSADIPTEPIWAILALALGVLVGFACGVAAVLILRGREQQGVRIAVGATLLNLVARRGRVAAYEMGWGTLPYSMRSTSTPSAS